ncbi:putative DD34D transposase [Trichonephila clavipes]|nr:putative DD34D transposase [Trichonephila clavipes]
MMDRVSSCKALAKRNKIDPFFKRMVTRDEKWIPYCNIDAKTIVVKELLPHDQTLNSDIYCQQLDRLKKAINQKLLELAIRRGVVFHQDNPRPHTFVVTHQKFWKLGWEVLIHPPDSPDMALSDYYLFLNCKTSCVVRNWDHEKIAIDQKRLQLANRMVANLWHVCQSVAWRSCNRDTQRLTEILKNFEKVINYHFEQCY